MKYFVLIGIALVMANLALCQEDVEKPSPTSSGCPCLGNDACDCDQAGDQKVCSTNGVTFPNECALICWNLSAKPQHPKKCDGPCPCPGTST